jgi:hypothetical protein
VRIKNVYIWGNACVIVDEKVGPCTIECGPDIDGYEKELSRFFCRYIYKFLFIYPLFSSGPTNQAMDRNTVVFHVDLTCERT